jgi:hypothetical protein
MAIFSGKCPKLRWKSEGPSRSRGNLRTPYPGKASSNPLDNPNPGLGVLGSSIRIRRVLAYELRPNYEARKQHHRCPVLWWVSGHLAIPSPTWESSKHLLASVQSIHDGTAPVYES